MGAFGFERGLTHGGGLGGVPNETESRPPPRSQVPVWRWRLRSDDMSRRRELRLKQYLRATTKRGSRNRPSV